MDTYAYTYYISGLVLVVKCFEFHARGLSINPLESLTLLHASLNVLIGLGTIINIGGFTAGTI
jgi:hypothetical protein